MLALLKGLPSPRILEEKSPKILTRRSDCEAREEALGRCPSSFMATASTAQDTSTPLQAEVL